jgi:hypothetical protein
LHLAAQPANACLAAGLDQQAQPFLDGSAFGSHAGPLHRFFHQCIVYFDVGTHDVYIMPVYVYKYNRP